LQRRTKIHTYHTNTKTENKRAIYEKLNEKYVLVVGEWRGRLGRIAGRLGKIVGGLDR